MKTLFPCSAGGAKGAPEQGAELQGQGEEKLQGGQGDVQAWGEGR